MIDKTEVKKKYKNTLTPMGVYQIKNLINGKVFIAASKNIPARLNRHKFALRFGSEKIIELLDDYKKIGEKNFSFETLDLLKPKDDPDYNYKDDLITLEELWIEKLQPFDERGYNKR